MNEKIYYVGDSITHSGIYISYIYGYMSTHYPERKMQFINKGKCGDTAFDAIQRLPWDMFNEDLSGNSAIMMFGMNDVDVNSYPIDSQEKEKSKELRFIEYKKNMRSLVDLMLQNGLKLTLVSPSPYDQTAKMETQSHYGANDSLVLYSEYCSELAVQYSLPYIDIHSTMTELNKQMQSLDAGDSLICQDRVHPERIGALTIAYLVLESMEWIKKSPQIEISADSRKAITTECDIIKLDKDEKHIFLTVKPSIIPIFEDEIFLKAKKLIPIDSWNDFNLNLNHFSQENFIVKINDSIYEGSMNDEINLFDFSDEIKSIVNQNNKLNDERRQLETILRDIVMVDVNLTRQGIAYDDHDSIDAYFKNEYEKAANKEWFLQIITAYSKKIDTPDIKREIINKTNMMYDFTIPNIHIDILNKNTGC